MNKTTRAAALAATLALSTTPLLLRAADLFDFIPDGGRTIFAKAFANRAPDAELNAVLSARKSPDEWLSYLRGHDKAITGLQKLDEREMRTLADYLAANMPRADLKPPAPPSQANWAKALPPDGRDFALNYCQGCHIITVVITQKRTKEAWLGTMGKPSHVQIKLKPDQREALANYLVVNGGIPIDEVPEELRAGGATY